MRKHIVILVATLLAATAACAQNETPSTTQKTPAIATTGKTNPSAPVAGKNSFTQAQAKSRIEKAGFTAVKDLKLDNQGVWRATATRDGKQVGASLDFQGNVTQAK